MINPWVEVSVGLFRDIFKAYLGHSGDTEGKVIEIQNLASIYFHDDRTCSARIFLGAGMDPFEFGRSNEALCDLKEAFERMGMGEKFMNDLKVLNICYFCDGEALISPVGATKTNTDMFFITCFGDSSDMDRVPSLRDSISDTSKMVVWFKRDSDGKYIYDSSRKPGTDDEAKQVRIRVMDLEDWKTMMLEGETLRRFPEKYKKDDIKKDEIILVG